MKQDIAFCLKKIEKDMEQQKLIASVSDDKTSNAELRKAMETERPMTVKKKSEPKNYASDMGGDDQFVMQKPAGQHVGFNPFSYPGMYSLELGQNQTVAVLDFPDKREDSKQGNTHIGTIYGAVYHNPLYEINSAQPVNDDIMDAFETLFMANGFTVNKYAGNSKNTKGERFLGKRASK